MFRRPVGKARKSRNIWHIPSFRNAAMRDAWAHKMLSYFCASPKDPPTTLPIILRQIRLQLHPIDDTCSFRHKMVGTI